MSYPSHGGMTSGSPGSSGSVGPMLPRDGGSRPPGDPRRANWPVIIVVGLLAIALGVGGGWLLTRTVGGGPARPDNVGGGPDASTAEVVRAYLEAVAAGDAGTALSLGASQPADTTLMTAEILARVNEHTLISEINVPETTESPVPVSFMLGTRRVNAEIPVVDTEDGPRLRQTWGILRLAPSGGKDLPKIVHGVPIVAEETPVFPGVYPVSTGRQLIDWGPESTGVITRPDSYSPDGPRLNPRLTDAGVQQFSAATNDYLTGCLAQKTLEPAGCPFSASAYDTVDNGSAGWSAVEDPMAGFEPRLDYDNVNLAVARMSFTVRATWKEGGTVRTSDRYVGGRATFDIGDDEKPAFAWQD